MFNWYREWIQIRKESRVCESCETLRHQLEVVNFEKKQLLDKLLNPEKPEPVKEPALIIPPKGIPWAVRKQMLEQEDREKAKLMREAPKPVSLEELEKDFGFAAKEREEKTG